MIAGSLAVGYSNEDPSLDWGYSGKLYVSREHDGSITALVNEIRNKKGRIVRCGLVRFVNEPQLDGPRGDVFDGFVTRADELAPDGRDLAGLLEGHDIPLPKADPGLAPRFLLACTIALENHSRT